MRACSTICTRTLFVVGVHANDNRDEQDRHHRHGRREDPRLIRRWRGGLMVLLCCSARVIPREGEFLFRLVNHTIQHTGRIISGLLHGCALL